MVSAKTEPPTLFTTRLAPLPPVAFMTASAKSPERVRIPASSPSALSLSSFSADPEVPITFASSALAVCSAATPTPAEMPVTSSHSPDLSLPWAISMSCTTMKTSGIDPASSQERFAGIAIASRASMSEYSAKAPVQRPMTRSPILNPVTPEPSLATSPAPSLPAALAAPPALTLCPTISSPRFKPAARMRTSSCPGPGSGTGASRSSRAVFPDSGRIQYDFISSPPLRPR